MSVVHPNCCGLDVHKKVIAACMVLIDESGIETTLIEEFRTFTDELEDLRDWLLEHDCPIVAMESTGVYWRPIHNIRNLDLREVSVTPKSESQAELPRIS